MLNESAIQLLRCPDDQSTLALIDENLVAALNDAIAVQRLRNRAGRLVAQPLDGGLIRAAGDLLYPIIDQIPLLLFDEAIPLDQLPPKVPDGGEFAAPSHG